MGRLLASCLAVSLTACMVNVPLQAPPPTAPPDVRMQAYAELAPAGEKTITTVTVMHNSTTVHQTQALVLRDGRTVQDPAELTRVVDPDSPTAHAAQRVAEARRSGTRWGLAGLAIAGVGLGMFLAGGYQHSELDSMGNVHEGGVTTLGWAGLGVALVGATAGLYGVLANVQDARAETATAFATYDESLRARLRICANGMQLMPCP